MLWCCQRSEKLSKMKFVTQCCMACIPSIGLEQSHPDSLDASSRVH